jgi:hypothetical protein
MEQVLKAKPYVTQFQDLLSLIENISTGGHYLSEDGS